MTIESVYGQKKDNLHQIGVYGDLNPKIEASFSLYRAEFVKQDQGNIITQAVDLVNFFNKKGLMLPTTLEHYQQVASNESLVVAEDGNGRIIGTVAYTHVYEGDIWEFGGWAVDINYQRKGIGMKLIEKLFKGRPHYRTIAFGNKNSGPILESLGAKIIDDHSNLPKAAFDLCAECPNKPKVGCCDVIYDLAPVISKLALQSS